MNNIKLEIACFNPDSAFIAELGGADRVELCDNFSVGGITPQYDVIKSVRQKLKIDLFIMIRPRGGDFIYSDSEFQSMKEDVEYCKTLGVNGVVFGILNADNTVDMERNRDLVELAKPLSCSFHRAFDVVVDPLNELGEIINCGFSTVLTSGQKSNAMEGIDLLTKLSKVSQNRIVIMPGGGVRSSNIDLLKEKINTVYFHSSAIKQNELADLDEVKLLKQKLS